MISEGFSDAEDWSNHSLCITGINYILNHNNISKYYCFNVVLIK